MASAYEKTRYKCTIRENQESNAVFVVQAGETGREYCDTTASGIRLKPFEVVSGRV